MYIRYILKIIKHINARSQSKIKPEELSLSTNHKKNLYFLK